MKTTLTAAEALMLAGLALLPTFPADLLGMTEGDLIMDIVRAAIVIILMMNKA
jgi:hypothetical protein